MKVTDYALNELYDVMKTLTSVGMAAWMAPGMSSLLPNKQQYKQNIYIANIELLSGEVGHSQATTVYAFGMLMWETYVRKVPYEKIHPIKLVTEILNGHRPDVPHDCPSVSFSFLLNHILFLTIKKGIQRGYDELLEHKPNPPSFF